MGVDTGDSLEEEGEHADNITPPTKRKHRKKLVVNTLNILFFQFYYNFKIKDSYPTHLEATSLKLS